MRFQKLIVSSVLAVSAFVSAPAVADDVRVELSGTRVSLDQSTARGLSNFTLRVSGPDGYIAEVFSRSAAPSLRLTDFGQLPDGRYVYELTAATQQTQRQVGRLRSGENGRSGVAQAPRVGMQQDGYFVVQNGRIVQFDPTETENN